MEKLLKILHKKLDKKIKNKEMQNKTKLMKEVFEKEHIHYIAKNAFSYYENEVIFHSLLNKQAIEKAYMEGYTKMYDYFDVLDFKEKQRLMNYEIHECLKNLPYLSFREDKIYIAFFDEKLNRIYQNEMVLFALKQYRRIMHDYQDLWKENYYGNEVYKSSLSSLEFIEQNDCKSCFYDSKTNRFFFLENDLFYDYITFEVVDNAIKRTFALAFFDENYEEMIAILNANGCINDKLAKKLLKKSHFKGGIS